MKTLMFFGLSISFSLLSCSSEMEVFTALPNGQKVSSIKVVYHDEYGDMPEYDGKYYSWVEFDRKGRIKDIMRGTLQENPDYKSSEFLTRPYTQFSINNMVWYLDYGFYPDVSLLAYGPDGWANQKAKEYDRFANHGIMVKRDFNNNPIEISSTSEAGHTRPFGFNEQFIYADNGKLTLWKSAHNIRLPSGEENSSYHSKQFAYNESGQVVSIREENNAILISYENDNVVEVKLEKNGVVHLRHEYFYNDMGLRTKSITYNTRNEKEFSQEYEYRYF